MSTKQLSITIDKNNSEFLENVSKNQKKPRSEVINTILTEYRKFVLKKEIEAGFKNQTNEDLKDSMLGFDNYLNIVNND